MYPNSVTQSSCGGVTPNNQPQLHQNTGLTHLTIKGYANNELRLQRSTSPQTRKKLSDKAETRKAEYRAKLIKLAEQLKNWLKGYDQGREPELWIPQSTDGLTSVRLYNDVCELDDRMANAAANKGHSIIQFTEQVKKSVNAFIRQEFNYFVIPVELNPITKEVSKRWDKTIDENTEWLDEKSETGTLFYRAKPCFEQVTIPVSRLKELPGTSLKLTWHKHTVSKAECERVLTEATRALDITNVLQETVPLGSDNRKTCFGSYSRHSLLEAGAVIDQTCGLNAVEVTLTLPGSTPESIRKLAAYSSWIDNRIFQVIRDYRRKYGKDIGYFHVWELQKRGALHKHICIAANPNELNLQELERLGLKLKDMWFQCLKEMATTKAVKRFGKKGGLLPGIDMFARKGGGSWRNKSHRWQWHVTAIHKSVAAYFSKYAGKQHRATDKKVTNKAYCPSRWWGKSKSVQNLIKASRFSYTIDLTNLESSSILEAINQQLELHPIVKAYGYYWEVKEEKYRVRKINGENWYCKKGIIKGELEPVKLASQGCNPTRVLMRGITQIYYYDPKTWLENWQFWLDNKGLIQDLAAELGKPVNSCKQI